MARFVRTASFVLCILLLALGAQAQQVAATADGMEQPEPLHRNLTDKIVRETADAMISSGMRDAGYIYVHVDDPWEGGRDANTTTGASPVMG